MSTAKVNGAMLKSIGELANQRDKALEELAGQKKVANEMFDELRSHVQACNDLKMENERLREALSTYADEADVLGFWESADPQAPKPTHSVEDCLIPGEPTSDLAEFMRPALEALGRLPLPSPRREGIFCPNCNLLHIDEGEWATRPHKTHRCVSYAGSYADGCGHEWDEPAPSPLRNHADGE